MELPCCHRKDLRKGINQAPQARAVEAHTPPDQGPVAGSRVMVRQEGTLLLLAELELQADLLAFLPEATRESHLQTGLGRVVYKKKLLWTPQLPWPRSNHIQG